MRTADWAGFVLLGGRSTRLGRDKALLSFGGQPLAALAAARLRESAGSAALVGARELYARLGAQIGSPVIEDVVTGRGPLGGIHAILAQSRTEWNLVAACDLPFLSVAFLRFLRAQASASEERTNLVVPISARGYELVLAIRSNALRAAEEALSSGENRLSRFYERLCRTELSPADYAPFDPRGMLFENVNTPEDLDRVSKNWPRSRGEAEQRS